MSKLARSISSLTIIRPDDWHLHLRDDEILRAVSVETAKRFGRAIIMPNLTPPVTTVDEAILYRDRIITSTQGYDFDPLMTIYLTDNTTVEEIEKCADSKYVFAAKLYPAGATTNSDAGVTDISKIYPVLEKMAERELTLCVHGEVTHGDIFGREKAFINEVLIPLRKKIPNLKIVFEHITTKAAAKFVLESDDNIGATITPQHLYFDRNDLLVGGIKPHLYCLPILKKDSDKQALIKVATSGNPRFFLGTDSAPHIVGNKESSCGCAGCFNVVSALEIYAEIFDFAGALNNLEAFTSKNGPDFYGLPYNTSTITLQKVPMTVQEKFSYSDTDDDKVIIPLHAGKQLQWSIKN